jgi:CheY-like chemotaxis protein
MNLSEATILIVDDEPELLEITAESLARVAGRVLTANNGAVALQTLKAARVDAIVSDVRMPVMDGIELLKNVRSSFPQGLAMMMVSGFSDLTAREAFDLGAAATLAKPVRRKDMIQGLERALADQKQLWREPAPEVENASFTLSRDFASLPQAISAAEIAFGRGGFCIRATEHLREAPVHLAINFAADHQTLSGGGMVRWFDPKDKLAGVEILSLAVGCLDWVAGLTREPGRSFIPAQPQSPALAPAHAAAARVPLR